MERFIISWGAFTPHITKVIKEQFSVSLPGLLWEAFVLHCSNISGMCSYMYLIAQCLVCFSLCYRKAIYLTRMWQRSQSEHERDPLLFPSCFLSLSVLLSGGGVNKQPNIPTFLDVRVVMSYFLFSEARPAVRDRSNQTQSHPTPN